MPVILMQMLADFLLKETFIFFRADVRAVSEGKWRFVSASAVVQMNGEEFKVRELNYEHSAIITFTFWTSINFFTNMCHGVSSARTWSMSIWKIQADKIVRRAQSEGYEV